MNIMNRLTWKSMVALLVEVDIEGKLTERLGLAGEDIEGVVHGMLGGVADEDARHEGRVGRHEGIAEVEMRHDAVCGLQGIHNVHDAGGEMLTPDVAAAAELGDKHDIVKPRLLIEVG